IDIGVESFNLFLLPKLVVVYPCLVVGRRDLVVELFLHRFFLADVFVAVVVLFTPIIQERQRVEGKSEKLAVWALGVEWTQFGRFQGLRHFDSLFNQDLLITLEVACSQASRQKQRRKT